MAFKSSLEYRREYLRNWHAKNPGRHTDYTRFKNYGITRVEFNELLSRQDYLCAICQCSLDDIKQYVDHNHATGQIRGILCRLCNVGIGHFGDNVEYLTRAISYITENGY